MNRVDYFDELIELYVDKRMSILDCAEALGKSRKAIWYQLNKLGLTRGLSDALKVSVKVGQHLKGKKRTFTTEHRTNMSKAARNRPAKGYRLKAGYYVVTAGPNMGRPLHRVMVEEHYGIKLKHDQVIHHKNGIKTDNRINNLEIMTNAEHIALHASEREIVRGERGQILTSKQKSL